MLHSGYSNIRLESYLFTTEAFADIKKRLKPGGLFVMYNYFRKGGLCRGCNAMLDQTFGKRQRDHPQSASAAIWSAPTM